MLLVDDQAIIAEAVRRMLAGESDIRFHYCADPTKAIEQANAIGPDGHPAGPGHAGDRRADAGQVLPRQSARPAKFP